MSSDSHFPAGEEVLLRLDDGRSLVFVVEKAYEPFSKAVVLLARCDDFSSSSVIIKINDPRYLDYRFQRYMTGDTPRPWDLDAEAAIREHPEPLWWGFEHNSIPDELYEDEDEPKTDEKKAHCAARWELFFQKKSKEYFEAELGAYNKLADLQGVVIPRLLGVGHHIPSDRRFYMPHALILEFIDGMTISSAPASALTPSIMSQLYQDIQLLNPCGVIHNDLKSNNIIISSTRQRAVIFDFGSACVRGDNESDEEWAGEPSFDYDETGVVAALLWQKRIPWRPDFRIPFYSFYTA